MSPKDKAYELFMYYYEIIPYTHTNAQRRDVAVRCAIKVVDEIIKAKPTAEYGDPFIGNHSYDNVSYWQDVKQEIEKL